MAKKIRRLMNLGPRTIEFTEAWHIGPDGKPDAHYLWPKREVDRAELMAMYPQFADTDDRSADR